MDVHDPHRLPLLVVGGRIEQGEIEPGAEQRRGEYRGPGEHDAAQAQEPGRIGEAVHDGA